MKKVLAFLLVLALALGCIGYAHASVTKNQETLTFYPTVEIGDPSVLEGLTASVTLTCGPHLRWYPQHTFGGGTVTESSYSRKGFEWPVSVVRRMSVSLLDEDDVMYSSQFHSVVAATPAGGSTTRKLPVHEMLSDYSPDFYIEYLDGTMECDPHRSASSRSDLAAAFRFLVREEDIASITVTRDAGGSISERSVFPENGPELELCYDMNADGVWFLLQCRDENGMRPYQSPAGHGLYFMPWKSLDRTAYDGGPALVQPDADSLRLCVPLDESIPVMDLMVAPERRLVHLLTQEDGMYILSTCDLDSGSIRSRLALLPCDVDGDTFAFLYRYRGDQLLLRIEDQIVLTDAAGEALLLTAPLPTDHRFNFDPESGDLYFDGETLFLSDLYRYDEAIFAITAWSEGARTYYGEYGCSLTKSDVDWYYSYVRAQGLVLEGHAPGEEE